MAWQIKSSPHSHFHSLSGGATLCIPTTESRRLIGLSTRERYFALPSGQVAPLQVDAGQSLGNYANDHHYPGVNFLSSKKSIRWEDVGREPLRLLPDSA